MAVPCPGRSCDPLGVEVLLLIVAAMAAALGLAAGAWVGARRWGGERPEAGAVGRSRPAEVDGAVIDPAGTAGPPGVAPAVAPAAAPAAASSPVGLAALSPAAPPAAPPDPDLEALIDAAGIGLIRLSPDLVVRSANPASHVLLGRRPGVLPGRSAMEAFTDHRAEEFLRLALASGGAVGELAVRGRDARALVLRARRAADGDVWVGLEDVTELRRLQRIRAEFIDNLSHELRTPLTTISLLAETLSMDADNLPPKVAERVAKIEVETGHLVQMVNELLELSRIESDGRPLVVDDLDLVRLAAATVERITLFAERQGVRLRLEAAADVPHVRGDAARLGQALLNLVHNAVKFSPSGREVVVAVRPGDGEAEVMVAVVDQGIGIPAAALPRIFERFYKVDRARVREGARGGTGLGLSIARHVVEAHGGRIWAESEEGVGSTFAFTIPVAGAGGRGGREAETGAAADGEGPVADGERPGSVGADPR